MQWKRKVTHNEYRFQKKKEEEEGHSLEERIAQGSK